jgi:hypothetical protein
MTKLVAPLTVSAATVYTESGFESKRLKSHSR